MLILVIALALLAAAFWLYATHQAKARFRAECVLARAVVKLHRAEHAALDHLEKNQTLKRELEELTKALVALSLELAAITAERAECDADHLGGTVPPNAVNFPIPSQVAQKPEFMGAR